MNYIFKVTVATPYHHQIGYVPYLCNLGLDRGLCVTILSVRVKKFICNYVFQQSLYFSYISTPCSVLHVHLIVSAEYVSACRKWMMHTVCTYNVSV